MHFLYREQREKCKQERMKNSDLEKKLNNFTLTLKIGKEDTAWIKIIPESSEPNFV